LEASPVKRLESVCESVLNGPVADEAAVILEKLDMNVVRTVLELFVPQEPFSVDVELNGKLVFNSDRLYSPVISVRFIIPKPEKSLI